VTHTASALTIWKEEARMRIWDLRRGDAVDDRTSLPGRSLLSVVFAAALEFNLLQAAIGLLTLIIGPALLVGLAPSVVVTYVRLKVHAAASAGDSLLVAVVLVAVLVGVALGVGRPLLAMAVDNFWHLHYTLVFPLFVAVRELLRALMEWWRGRSIPPDQLERGRRLATVLAASLLGGGGLTLAVLVDVSLGLQLVDVTHVRVWAVAQAALGNAAVVLGLSMAAQSLYWIWRELSLKGPVRDWVPTASNADASIVRVAHLSDLHLVGERYGYRMEAGTHGPRGNRCIRRAWRRLAAIHAVAPVDRVFVTGDVTDAGTRAEWAEFLDLLRGCPTLRARLSFVPGNHDVNVIDRTNPARLELPWSAGQALRQLRVVLALDAIQGERAHVVDHASGVLGPSLKDYLRDGGRAKRLRALAQRGTMRGRREMAEVWEAIFPLVEPPRASEAYGVILLNSNARSHVALTNAIGVVTPSQLRALKLVLQMHPRHAWLILLHHHVVEHPGEAISLHERIVLALTNAPDVLAALAPHAARILVLHGHRHRDWIGAYGEVALCSAPSTALGADGADKYRGSFHVHDLAVGAGGGVRLTRTERVRVG
jgi:3',5'-cyclic AMP phosphodiesterase CpdA